MNCSKIWIQDFIDPKIKEEKLCEVLLYINKIKVSDFLFYDKSMMLFFLKIPNHYALNVLHIPLMSWMEQTAGGFYGKMK